MILAALALLAAPAEAGPRVAVTGGEISGSSAGLGTPLLFRGIPFAAPPLADRRWRAPRPVIAWQGTRPDNPDAPACPQNDYGWNHADHVHGSEDCLTLDVATPALRGKHPVMVWIHGGSNRAGSARGTVTSSIVSGGVVLVAIQYRLGILGFLAHRGGALEAAGHAGNYGLMDQIAALRWVRANIARFGGDPDKITIFGESAGSQDVSLMLAAPDARGLFAHAIMESGTPGFGMPSRPLKDALALGDQADILLASGGSLSVLRTRSVAELLAADLRLADTTLRTNDYLWLRTTIDGAVLPEPLPSLLAKAPPIPVIIGSNRAEFGPGPGELRWDEALRATFGDRAMRARALYRLDDPHRQDDPRLGHVELEYETDRLFRCPSGRLADLLAARGAPVWRYEFDIGVDGGRTSHGAEIAFVLGEKRFAAGLSLRPYWLNFARTGDPNTTGLPTWPRYDRAAQRYARFVTEGVKTGTRLRSPLCSLLAAL